jgi:hypothetical protein
MTLSKLGNAYGQFQKTNYDHLVSDKRSSRRWTGIMKPDCPIVLQRTARLLTLAIVLAFGCVFDWSSHAAQAQQVQHGSQLDLDYSLPTRPGPKLRNVRRPPKMPPAPTDFGPHFDFPSGGSQNFNCGSGPGYYCGAPSQAPYPN